MDQTFQIGDSFEVQELNIENHRNRLRNLLSKHDRKSQKLWQNVFRKGSRLNRISKMSTTTFHPLKDPELFFQNVVDTFEKKGIDMHLQASFISHIAKEIQKSNNFQLRQLKTQPFRRGLTDEYAMQVALQYLVSKKLDLTLQCGQTELPIFKVYKTPTTIYDNLHLQKNPSTWLSDIYSDRLKQITENNGPNSNQEQ